MRRSDPGIPHVMDEVVPTFYRELCPGTVKSDQVALFEINSGDSGFHGKFNHL